jgi:hypothetical protein
MKVCHCAAITALLTSRYEIMTGGEKHVYDRAMCSTWGQAGRLVSVPRYLCKC